MGGSPLRAEPTGATFEEVYALTNFPKIFFILFFIYIFANRDTLTRVSSLRIERAVRDQTLDCRP